MGGARWLSRFTSIKRIGLFSWWWDLGGLVLLSWVHTAWDKIEIVFSSVVLSTVRRDCFPVLKEKWAHGNFSVFEYLDRRFVCFLRPHKLQGKISLNIHGWLKCSLCFRWDWMVFIDKKSSEVSPGLKLNHQSAVRVNGNAINKDLAC